ncbi:hypothetical protein CEXT_524581 [Caerostris extrusa]|uniref:Uncharacterized protein n=1 Tax=Caerostris extrusa TaxID=172846 RepID=A0AAV4NZL5_CAEEX|nr:hypothetical protein CEXT_524581 [Caerostris extrusa]
MDPDEIAVAAKIDEGAKCHYAEMDFHACCIWSVKLITVHDVWDDLPSDNFPCMLWKKGHFFSSHLASFSSAV